MQLYKINKMNLFKKRQKQIKDNFKLLIINKTIKKPAI
jgi:hypothetical protein